MLRMIRQEIAVVPFIPAKNPYRCNKELILQTGLANAQQETRLVLQSWLEPRFAALSVSQQLTSISNPKNHEANSDN